MPADLPLHRPLLGDAEISAVTEVLQSGFLVQGPKVAAFEAGLAERLGLAEVIACSSGTAALHLALAAMDCSPGDEVIVPAFGFPATANAVELCGATAIPADIDPERMSLSVESVSRRATERTVGVVPVHPFGIPAPMPKLTALADERGWWMVEDAACALGTETQGRWSQGEHPVCLSFHPRKTVTTGEGGAVGVNDPALACRLRQLRNHGIAADGVDRGWSRFTSVGFNYRMTDLAAAIGVVQLDRLDEFVSRRRQVVAWYREHLATIEGVRWPQGYELERLSTQSLVVEVLPEGRRDRVITDLAAQGISTTIGGYGLASQPFWAERDGLAPSDYPVATRMAEAALTLPVTHEMTESDVRRVVHALDHATRLTHE
ncbi:MAG: DegT/DnrJ/EryC1/StrS family aminotransferase [Myxococcota bacterium]